MMNDNNCTRLEKTDFEPSQLVEYGDAEQVTEASPTPNAGTDGSNYTS
jgi:hypothetical protein